MDSSTLASIKCLLLISILSSILSGQAPLPLPVAPPLLYTLTSGSSTAYSYTVQPSYALIPGSQVQFIADVTNTGSATLQMIPTAAKTLKKLQGTTNLVAGDIQAGAIVYVIYDGVNWQIQSPIGNAPFTLPSGSNILITSGTCPSGFTENSSLDGVTVIGTLNAHGNIGTTGGSDNITPGGSNSIPSLTMNSYTPSGTNGTSTVTPSGTISYPINVPIFTGSSTTVGAQTFTGDTTTVGAQTFTGSSTTVPALGVGTLANTWPVGVPTFSGSSGTVPAQTFTGSAGTVPAQTFTGSSATTSATSGGTPAGTNGASATSGNCAATNIAAGTGSTTACKATAPNLTVTAQTFTGSALGTHTHTLTATGTNGTAAFTPAGTNATVSFTPSGTIAWPAGVPTIAGSTVTGSLTPLGSNGSVNITPLGHNSSNSITPLGSIGWPMNPPTFAGNVNTVGAQVFTGQAATLTGSVTAPNFTGNSFDNRSSFIRGIFCSKN